MTSDEHNKFVAAAFLVHGFMQFMVLLLIAAVMVVMLMAIPEREKADIPPVVLYTVVMGFIILFQLAFALPSLIAGYALWKRKRWAKTAGIVGGVLSAMHFPIGTLVCAYAFWFLLGDAGKAIYPPKQPSLRAGMNRMNPVYEQTYTPPPQPPSLWD
jgi:hypothetical protein